MLCFSFFVSVLGYISYENRYTCNLLPFKTGKLIGVDGSVPKSWSVAHLDVIPDNSLSNAFTYIMYMLTSMGYSTLRGAS